MTFHQSVDCKLEQATVTMAFRGIQGSPASPHSKNQSDLEITELFGPQSLTGEKREKQVSTTLEANPKVGNANMNVEGFGWSRTSDATYSSRWKFTGSRFTSESSSVRDDTRGSRYRQLVWHLEENELEHQVVHAPTVHSALAFHHCSEPFYLDLQIEIKMKRWHHRLRQNFVCPPRNRKAWTRTRIEPSENAVHDTLFAHMAKDLDRSMTEANLHPVVEISDPRPSIMGDNSSSIQENETGADLKCPTNESILALARQLTGQELPGNLPETKLSSVIPLQPESSSSTLVESISSKDPDERTEPVVAVPEIDNSFPSPSSKEVEGIRTLHAAISHTAYSVLCQASQLVAVLVASLILGLNNFILFLPKRGNENESAGIVIPPKSCNPSG